MTLSALSGDERETLRARLTERMALAEAGHDTTQVNAVREALFRMDRGGYGVCADCEAPIPFERLFAQPNTPRCIRCETERDRLRARPSLPAP
jgi:DnaK suppressor protein